MSFHPDQHFLHLQNHIDDLQRDAAAGRAAVACRRARSMHLSARLLDAAALVLARFSGWFGTMATRLHAKARVRRANAVNAGL